MSVYQSSGIRRNGSAMTGHRQDRLPFALDRDEALSGRGAVRLVESCGRQMRLGFFVVRLCPRAEVRISALLAVPDLHPDVRGVYQRLLAWADVANNNLEGGEAAANADAKKAECADARRKDNFFV